MTDGTEVECRNCRKKFWIGVKLSFGARKKKNAADLLNCFLEEITFYFKCPYCKYDSHLGFKFYRSNQPEIETTIGCPTYIG